MPRKETTCARRPQHKGECRSAEALADTRERKTARRRGKRTSEEVSARRRWNQAYRFRRYNITEQQFNWLLKVQEFACAMCGDPFGEDCAICVDHDHDCCMTEKKSCGKCIRGLLCLDCNTTLGKIERKLHLAQAYLAAPPTGDGLPGLGPSDTAQAVSGVW
jgi:hypothetical protein